MKYFIVLMDDGTLLKGTTNIETKEEFFKKYLELTDHYKEVNNNFSEKEYPKIKNIFWKYLNCWTENLKFTSHEMRIIYNGFKILDGLIKEPGLLGLVESEYHGLESMEEFWIYDRLEDANINEEEKNITIFGDKFEFKRVEWI